MRRFLSVVVMALPIFNFAAQDWAATNENAMCVMQFMNHLNYVTHVLSTYQNAFVIEEEYRRLQHGNLDLNKIPNTEIRDAISSMVKTIGDLRVREARRKRFLEKQQARLEREKALVLRRFVSSCADGLAIGSGLIVETVNAYEEYKKAQSEINAESSDYQFEYDLETDRNLRAQNDELFKLQYGLTREYGLNDAWRLSPENAKVLSECMASTDVHSKYDRLREWSRVQPSYSYCVPFWYHYALVSYEVGAYEESMRACDRFFHVNRCLFKHDMMAAKIAMTKALLKIRLGSYTKEELVKLLEIILTNNYDYESPEMTMFCASVFANQISNAERALQILDALLGYLEQKYDERMKVFQDAVRSLDRGVFEFAYSRRLAQVGRVPLSVDLAKVQIQMAELISQYKPITQADNLENGIGRLKWDHRMSGQVKLYSWNRLEPKRVRYALVDGCIGERGNGLESYLFAVYFKKRAVFHPAFQGFVMRCPLNWWSFGDFRVTVSLYSGEECVFVSSAESPSAEISLNGGDCAELHINCEKKQFDCADSIIMDMSGGTWRQSFKMHKLHNKKCSGFIAIGGADGDDIIDHLYVEQVGEYPLLKAFPYDADNYNLWCFVHDFDECDRNEKLNEDTDDSRVEQMKILYPFLKSNSYYWARSDRWLEREREWEANCKLSNKERIIKSLKEQGFDYSNTDKTEEELSGLLIQVLERKFGKRHAN